MKRFLQVALWCLYVLWPLGRVQGQAQCQNCYALVIGVTGYPNFEPDKRLIFADDDARMFYDFIRSPEGGAVPRENIQLMVNQQATREAILHALDSLRKVDRGGGLVFAFFAGHGIRHLGESYLIPYDASQQAPDAQGILMGEFVRRLDRVSSSLMIFIDACYAGAAWGSSLARDAGENAMAALPDIWERQLRGQAALRMGMLSAAETERAFEDSSLGHGLFTWYLITGLRGEADSDPRDGLVTASELYRYVLTNVVTRARQRHQASQNPMMLPGFQGSFVLAKLSAQTVINRTSVLNQAEEARRLFQLAFAAGEARRDAEAVALYRQTIQLDPQDATARNNLGVNLVRGGDTAGAIREYRESIRLNPRYGTPHHNLGNVLLAGGDPDGAIREYREAIRLKPGYARPHIGLGNIFYDRGDMDSAVVEYREAIRLDPTDAIPYSNVGVALDSLGDLDGAILAFRSALRIDSNYGRARTNLDRSVTRREALQRQIEAVRDSLSRDPTKGHLLSFLLHEKAHDFGASLTLLTDRILIHPDDVVTQMELAEANFTNGRFLEAESWIGRLLSVSSLETRLQIVLRALEIANLHALGKTYLVEAKESALASLISAQPDTFDLNWVFGGAKHFIRNDYRFTPYRRWLLQLLSALEAGRRSSILEKLPRTAPAAQLEWIKCEGDTWCSVNTVNLQHPHFENLEGVLVVWHGGASAATLRVRHGVVRDQISALRNDAAVQSYANLGLLVTWAQVAPAQRDGVEKYLVERLNPRFGSRLPDRTPLAANLPW